MTDIYRNRPDVQEALKKIEADIASRSSVKEFTLPEAHVCSPTWCYSKAPIKIRRVAGDSFYPEAGKVQGKGKRFERQVLSNTAIDGVEALSEWLRTSEQVRDPSEGCYPLEGILL